MSDTEDEWIVWDDLDHLTVAQIVFLKFVGERQGRMDIQFPWSRLGDGTGSMTTKRSTVAATLKEVQAAADFAAARGDDDAHLLSDLRDKLLAAAPPAEEVGDCDTNMIRDLIEKLLTAIDAGDTHLQGQIIDKLNATRDQPN